MADDRFGGLPSSSKEVIQEFCDRENFCDISDIEGFSDDEDADPSFFPPPPRIPDGPDEPEDGSEEDGQPSPPPSPLLPRGRGSPDEPVDQEDGSEEDAHSSPPSSQRVTRGRGPRGRDTGGRGTRRRGARGRSTRAAPRRTASAAVRGLSEGDWTVKTDFNPLPPAPWYDPDDENLHYISAMDSFSRYIPDELLETMAQATSANILAKKGIEMSLTIDDMKKFIGVTIKISYTKYPRIRQFWAASTRMPDIADTMPRDKYFLIRSNLRVRDYMQVNNEEKRNKYWKVAPLLSAVRNACLENPKPQEVSIDEQMVPFWGSTAMRQRVKGKPNPCGLKNFVACAPDGLPLDFFLYEGKGDTILPADELNYPDLDMSGKVIVRLTKELREGTSVFMDRFFTSVLLIDELHLRGFQGTGTLQKDRIPSDTPIYTDAEMRRGGRGYINQIVRNDGQIAIIKWYDNKPVILISSVHGAEPKDKCKRWSKEEKRYIRIDRPIVVKHYNDKMGGVDMLDRVMSYYRIKARTKKWTVRLVFHMFDFVVAAGWIYLRRVQAKENTPKRDLTDQLDYKIELADRLLLGVLPAPVDSESSEEDDGPDPDPVPKKKRPTPFPLHDKRTSGANHMPDLNPSSTTRHRCRLPGCNSNNARFLCTTCKVWLCITQSRNCYKLFHRL